MPLVAMKRRTTVARLSAVALLVGALVLLEGCYYMQAIRGHTDLMGRRRPVTDVIEDSASPAELKARLELVQSARDFAITDLLLPDNESYRSYADLERDYVVWNVFAAPEFSLTPKTWCYPVAGCVAYRGYFREENARKLESKLIKDGYDAAVGGVAAYSTLGRFPDPLLNTMMHWSDIDLVATMFHELAHQKLYVKGDTAFNESFATTVADIGIARWLEHTGELGRLAAYEARKSLRRDVFALVRRTRAELESLYASEIPIEEMRAQKRELLDKLSADAQRLIEEAGSDARNWLAPPLNNARLVSSNLYEGGVNAFHALFDDCERDLACFYTRAEALGELDGPERDAALTALAAADSD